MKPKYFLFAIFLAALVLSGKFYFDGSRYVAALMLLMALASALNVTKPVANKKTHFKDVVRLFVEQK